MPRGVAALSCIYGDSGDWCAQVRTVCPARCLERHRRRGPGSDRAGRGLSGSAIRRPVASSVTDPANFTPHILNGTVYSIVQVGDQIVVGGTFTQVRTATSSTVITRNRVFAFNATDRRDQQQLQPCAQRHRLQGAADARAPTWSTSVAASPRRQQAPAGTHLFRMNVNTGAVDTGFVRRPPSTGTSATSRWSATTCSSPASSPTSTACSQKGLGTLNATTGVRDTYFTNQLAGLHRPELAGSDSPTCCRSRATRRTPSSSWSATSPRVNGDGPLPDREVRPRRLECDALALEHQPVHGGLLVEVRHLHDRRGVLPRRQYFIVSTTGAYGGGTGSNNGTAGCDVVVRFEAGTTHLADPGHLVGVHRR